jgi:hypothetical protein
VSAGVELVDARCCNVPCRSLQRVWRDVVQQLQCRLCVPCWIDVPDTCCCHLPCRHVQRIWIDVV